MDHTDGALARLVGDIAEFESTYWGRAPLVRCGNGGAFSDVWSLSALDDFIATAPRRPLIRLVRDGIPIEADRYTSTIRLGGKDFSDVVEPSKVAAQLASGATVVAQSLHRTHTEVARFVDRLISEISHPVQANAYLTPPNSTGLALHGDRHDVLVVQVHGTKCWTIDGLGELELSDGDVMYLPAGTRHSATSTDQASLHLTIGILRVTYRSVLNRMLRDAPTSLDDPLPLRYRDDETSIDEALTKRLDAVRTHLGETDPSEVAAFERRRPRQELPDRNSLDRSIELLEIDGSTMIVRGDREWTVSPGDDELSDTTDVIVDDGRQRLVAPTATWSAIRRLESGSPVRISSLDGLDASSQLVLARRLLAIGLCELAQ